MVSISKQHLSTFVQGNLTLELDDFTKSKILSRKLLQSQIDTVNARYVSSEVKRKQSKGSGKPDSRNTIFVGILERMQSMDGSSSLLGSNALSSPVGKKKKKKR
jgi:hypothetical protein